MYYGGGTDKTKVNNQSQPLTSDFVSLVLKGRSDGFTIKGGDATAGKQTTMYDGPRPDAKIAGTCGHGNSGARREGDYVGAAVATKRNNGGKITVETCTKGNSNQVWSFVENGKSISCNNYCIDIGNYRTTQGSAVAAYPCGGSGVRENELWKVGGDTIASLQPNTPFCVGTKGTTAGSTTMLDSCTVTSSAFTFGFTQSAGTSGTIVQKFSSLCLTIADLPPAPPPPAPTPPTPVPPPNPHAYQPMRKQGAIILATGGDNSNRAAGNFYEGFMATGYASDATDEAIQANIVAVGYSGFNRPM